MNDTTLDCSDLDRYMGKPIAPARMKEPLHNNDFRRWVQAMHYPNLLHYDHDFAAAGRYGRIVAPQSFAVATDDGHGAAPACVGLIPNSHLIFGGDEWWFYGPRIFGGDEIINEKVPIDYVVKQTKFAGPTCFQRGDNNYYNQHGEPAATLHALSGGGRLLFNDLDDGYFPRTGKRLSVEVASILSSTSNQMLFSKLEVDFMWTVSLFSEQTVSPYFQLDTSSGTLPLYEKFRVGGPVHLPGFHLEERWGNHLVAAGLKYRLHVFKSWALETHVSAATTFGRIGAISFGRLEKGIGLTIVAISSAIGPLRLSHGWNEHGRRGLHLTVGYDF